MENWTSDLLSKIDRKKAEITFDPHLFNQKEKRNLDLDKIEETIRTGTTHETKCESPNKICFKRYFGKENETYTVIARYHEDFIEVKTGWTNKGR